MSSAVPLKPNPQTIPRRRAGASAPLSFAQERMVLLEQLTPGITAYNVPRVFRIGGRLDPGLLQQAFGVVVARHEPLRTTIELIDGEPVQRIAERASFELRVIDVLAASAAEGEAKRLVDELAWQPFDLERDSMLRATLLRVSGDEDWLVIVCHHLVSDYASLPILLGELAEAYQALAAGREPSLPELPIGYADFAVWQRQRLSGPVLEKSLAYWRERLAGAPEQLDLPADRPRPPVRSYRGALLSRSVAPEVVGRLRALARSNGVSFYVVLLAAVKTLLHRYTNEDDLVVGSPVSGRHHEETMPLVGFFTNMLVLRTSLAGDPTFDELVGRVRETVLGGLSHQELPFEKLVEALNPKRDLSRTPLFQVLLTHDVATPELELGGFRVDVVPVAEVRWSRFDLSLGVQERRDGGLDVSVEYSTDLFEPETIDRLLGHLESLLAGIAEEPARPISELPLLTSNERALLLRDWNATTSPLPDRCAHELVAAQARARPDEIAVQSEGAQLSYAELDLRSNQLAHHLRGLGIGTGSLAAVCIERSVDMVVALLAVWKAGGAYVPIDPAFPPERQRFMIDDSQVRVLLTQESLAEQLPAHGAEIVCVDRDAVGIAANSASPPACRVRPEELAYVIYTSGSTGVPKGVQISHRALVNFLTTMAKRPGFGVEDVLVAVTTLSFDIAGLELYLPLASGGRVVLASRETASDPRRLAELIDGAGATVVQATPTTWRMLVEAGWPGRPGLKALCGGEALPHALADQLLRCGVELWNMYGPTETTIWSTVSPVKHGDPLTIGRPIANTTLYILDERLEPVPIGIPGQLYIGGDGLARGYLNRPELTAERFVPHPFDPTPGARIYKTGDSARYRADGSVEFLGRLDHQVKLRGFRIELGEIEALLDRHPDVRTSAAAVRDGEAGEKLLVGYVELEPASDVTSEALRRHLSALLPAYAVPSVIVPVDEFPLTANGKLDRAALPAPDGMRPVLEQPYVAPHTPTEEMLAGIWEDLLPVDRVGIDDDFFDLGGHSMLALRLVARIQDTLDVDLFLTAVFEHPTVRQLSEVVSMRMLEDAAGDGLDLLLDELEAAEA
jgi:amino acid adenylation domain-containing protein